MSKKKRDDLDMETSFANMNVEGMRDYRPNAGNRKQGKVPRVSRKEYWQMVKGMFASILPMLLCVCLGFGVVIALAYLWLS